MKPIHVEAHEFGKELARARIGVEHFLFSKDALVSHELATTHFISSLTNGGLHLYQHYQSEKYLFLYKSKSQHLYYNIFNSLTKTCYYDVDFTCRSSQGLTITRYGAPEGLRESRDVGISMADATSSFTVELEQ